MGQGGQKSEKGTIYLRRAKLAENLRFCRALFWNIFAAIPYQGICFSFSCKHCCHQIRENQIILWSIGKIREKKRFFKKSGKIREFFKFCIVNFRAITFSVNSLTNPVEYENHQILTLCISFCSIVVLMKHMSVFDEIKTFNCPKNGSMISKTRYLGKEIIKF